MEALVEKGMVKAIGICNFSITKTERILKTAKIPPSLLQSEFHPYCQQSKLKDYCDSKGQTPSKISDVHVRNEQILISLLVPPSIVHVHSSIVYTCSTIIIANNH